MFFSRDRWTIRGHRSRGAAKAATPNYIALFQVQLFFIVNRYILHVYLTRQRGYIITNVNLKSIA